MHFFVHFLYATSSKLQCFHRQKEMNAKPVVVFYKNVLCLACPRHPSWSYFCQYALMIRMISDKFWVSLTESTFTVC